MATSWTSRGLDSGARAIEQEAKAAMLAGAFD